VVEPLGGGAVRSGTADGVDPPTVGRKFGGSGRVSGSWVSDGDHRTALSRPSTILDAQQSVKIDRLGKMFLWKSPVATAPQLSPVPHPRTLCPSQRKVPPVRTGEAERKDRRIRAQQEWQRSTDVEVDDGSGAVMWLPMSLSRVQNNRYRAVLSLV
jgi:hypothetical protein